jgi:hypothetical protein
MTFTRILTAALVIVAVATAPASAMPIDPLTTGGPTTISPTDDLRTPDSREGVVTTTSTPVDLRTPDGASGGGTGSPDVTLVEVPQSPVSGSGIEWDDAGLGAGIMLALALLGLAGFTVAHRRHGSAIAG